MSFICNECQRGIYWMKRPIIGAIAHGVPSLCCDECWPAVERQLTAVPKPRAVSTSMKAVVKAVYAYEGGKDFDAWMQAHHNDYEAAAKWCQNIYPLSWAYCYGDVTGEDWTP